MVDRIRSLACMNFMSFFTMFISRIFPKMSTKNSSIFHLWTTPWQDVFAMPESLNRQTNPMDTPSLRPEQL